MVQESQTTHLGCIKTLCMKYAEKHSSSRSFAGWKPHYWTILGFCGFQQTSYGLLNNRFVQLQVDWHSHGIKLGFHVHPFTKEQKIGQGGDFFSLGNPTKTTGCAPVFEPKTLWMNLQNDPAIMSPYVAIQHPYTRFPGFPGFPVLPVRASSYSSPCASPKSTSSESASTSLAKVWIGGLCALLWDMLGGSQKCSLLNMWSHKDGPKFQLKTVTSPRIIDLCNKVATFFKISWAVEPHSGGLKHAFGS